MKYLKNINGRNYFYVFLIFGVGEVFINFISENTDIQKLLLMIPFYALFYIATWFRMINLGWKKIFFWLFIYLSFIDSFLNYRIPFNLFGEDFFRLTYYPLGIVVENFGIYLNYLFYIVLLLLVILNKKPTISKD